ncbi:dehydrogenase/reductase SDR family member 12-like [Limulus polyphemus]|uniref:Dehydrogenase/reductase SDR family member 12-like n=1 Tax=Limulus polyphemus TaxID=6850 RepID=A0ABM1BLP0_LIMPO|nr:dehydrogenase/reductase SDR family member 12-like [Limulus polyphemus]
MSLFRNLVWFAKGMREYTKSGYQSASKSFNSLDLEVPCNGKVYMVTGANSGIGKVIAQEVAKKGGTVHMVCRNKERAVAAKQEIIENTGNENVEVHVVDMSEPKQVYRFAKDFVESHDVLNVLVNNAGCMINERELNSDGIEKNFAVNTLSVHILTTLLVPLLSKSVEPRVVTVSSGGMLVQKLNVNDLQFQSMIPFDGTMAYAQNKRQQVIMTEKYAEKYPGVHFSCMHPGWADTPGVRTSMPAFFERMKNRLRTAEEGADTAVWLAVSHAALKHASGMFYQDRKPVSTHLPLAWTKASAAEEDILMNTLDEMMEQFKC